MKGGQIDPSQKKLLSKSPACLIRVKRETTQIKIQARSPTPQKNPPQNFGCFEWDPLTGGEGIICLYHHHITTFKAKST